MMPQLSITFMQKVAGIFLCCTDATWNTILTKTSELGHEQANGTNFTLETINNFLNYAATFSDAKIRWCKSNMTLQACSGRSYLFVAKSYSWAARHFFLPKAALETHKATQNGPTHVLWIILKTFLESAAETEIVSTFENSK